MKKFILPLLAAGVAATPALAAPTITFTTTTALPSYTTATVFESFESQLPAVDSTGAAFNPALNAAGDATIGATETQTNASSGRGPRVYSASVPGVAQDTDGNPNNKYLAVQAGTSYTVTFASPVQFFSFIIGSIDSYNNLKLVLNDGTIVGGSSGLFGDQIIGQSSAGPVNSNVAGRVSYDFGGGVGLKSAIFSSSQDALEIDDLAAAVPEAATWAMMMVGLGMVGGALRRRQTKVSVRYANA